MTSQDTPDSVSPTPCRGGGSEHAAGATRRTVLSRGSLAALAGAGTLALAGCTQEIKDKENAQDHYAGSELTDALAAEDLPVGAAQAVEVNGRTLLMHRVDEETVTAHSNVCTHQGCLVQPVDRAEGPAYACPCHGSNFDPVTGEPFGGPARQPLMDYEAAVQDGRIVVKL